jgi:hypothetical protein
MENRFSYLTEVVPAKFWASVDRDLEVLLEK